MDSAVQNITIPQAKALAADEARRQVLTAMQELQDWVDAGRDVQTFILIKTNLYIKSTS
jgi:hypothetical protein